MKQPTLREIIEEAFDGNDFYRAEINQAEQAIKDLLLSKLPEGRQTPDTTSDYINGFQTGYDSAKAEFTKTIEGL